MTVVYCQYVDCESNRDNKCILIVITLANNLHDGATCMDTHFVNKREEIDGGKGGQTIRQKED